MLRRNAMHAHARTLVYITQLISIHKQHYNMPYNQMKCKQNFCSTGSVWVSMDAQERLYGCSSFS